MSHIRPVRWHKSSYSGQEGTACVEIADFGHAIAIRDSKNPDAPHLTVTPAAWQRLTTAIRS